MENSSTRKFLNKNISIKKLKDSNYDKFFNFHEIFKNRKISKFGNFLNMKNLNIQKFQGTY